MARQTTLSPEAIGYITTALWSSTDNSDETGGEPLDKNYDISDIDAETIMQMIRDVEDFVADNQQLLAESGLSRGRIGHDLWLNRNGHGAGFWDEGLGEVGERLSAAAHALGSYDLYVDDDGYISGS